MGLCGVGGFRVEKCYFHYKPITLVDFFNYVIYFLNAN